MVFQKNALSTVINNLKIQSLTSYMLTRSIKYAIIVQDPSGDYIIPSSRRLTQKFGTEKRKAQPENYPNLLSPIEY